MREEESCKIKTFIACLAWRGEQRSDCKGERHGA